MLHNRCIVDASVALSCICFELVDREREQRYGILCSDSVCVSGESRADRKQERKRGCGLDDSSYTRVKFNTVAECLCVCASERARALLR